MTMVFDGTLGLTNPGNLTVAGGNITVPSSMTLQTNGVNALWVDANQNLGVGATPSAWGSGRGGIELFGSVQPSVSFSGITANNGGSINTNTYNNGLGSWLYKNAGYASVLQTVNGGFQWYTAPSGSAGGTVSLTQMMGLSNGGIVTMPSQPAFSATGTAGQATYNSGSPFPFNTAITNVGSFFNTSTYTFTAPVAGRYAFFLQMYIYTTSVDGQIQLLKNGAQMVPGGDTNPLGGPSTGNSTTGNGVWGLHAILLLAAGDAITAAPRINSGSTISTYMPHSTFSGYLIG